MTEDTKTIRRQLHALSSCGGRGSHNPLWAQHIAEEEEWFGPEEGDEFVEAEAALAAVGRVERLRTPESQPMSLPAPNTRTQTGRCADRARGRVRQ
eukprot:1502216-Rhodomonas_salina.2